MALGALTLSVTQGVQGRPFASAISGLTTGLVEVLQDGAPGFYTVNGMLRSNGLPYPVSTAVLREYDPGAGAGYLDTRLEIAATTADAALNMALESLGVGRTLTGYVVAATEGVDGSLSYSVYARDDLGATVVTAVGGASGPAYAIVPLLGQSNMAGRGNYSAGTDTADDRVKQFPNIAADTATYRTIRDSIYPLYHPEDHRTDGEIGPGQTIGKAIAATLPTDQIVLLVPCAWGGTSLVNSNPNSAPNPPQWGVGRSLYEAAVAQVNAAIAAAQAIYPNSYLHSTHFLQGESDSTGTLAAAYDTALRGVITDWRARVTGAAGRPFVIGGMLPEKIIAESAVAGIDAVHRAVAASTANVHYVPGPYGRDSGDGTHYNAGGNRTQGTDKGKAGSGIVLVNFDKITLSQNEGSSGTTTINFTVLRSSNSGSLSVPVTFTAGTITADDFPGGTLPSGLSASWSDGQNSTTISVTVNGDTDLEASETFTFTLNPTAPVIVGSRPSITATVSNDDAGSGGGTNLIVSPQDATAWTTTGASVTADQVANPVGGATNADLVTESSGTAQHGIISPTSGAPTLTSGLQYTFAADVKANGRPNVQIYLASALGGSSTTKYANFNISAGTSGSVGTTGSDVTASVTALGGDWFRVSMTVVVTASGAASFALIGSNNTTNLGRGGSYSGNGSSGFYVCNQQIVTGPLANAF